MMVVVVVVAEDELGGGEDRHPVWDPVGPDCGPVMRVIDTSVGNPKRKV